LLQDITGAAVATIERRCRLHFFSLTSARSPR
jgi:hypothetical protein